MVHVALVAPHFLENTNRYVNAFARLDGVTLSVISADPQEAMPRELQGRVAHFQVNDVGDGKELAHAVQRIGKGVGRVDRLTGVLEQLQMPLAEARALANVPGMRPEIARRFRDKDRMK